MVLNVQPRTHMHQLDISVENKILSSVAGYQSTCRVSCRASDWGAMGVHSQFGAGTGADPQCKLKEST